jgi:hypothetical protein
MTELERHRSQVNRLSEESQHGKASLQAANAQVATLKAQLDRAVEQKVQKRLLKVCHLLSWLEPEADGTVFLDAFHPPTCVSDELGGNAFLLRQETCRLIFNDMTMYMTLSHCAYVTLAQNDR